MSEPTFMPLFIKVGSGYLCLNGPEQPRAHSNLFSLHLLNDRISAEAFNSCIVKYLYTKKPDTVEWIWLQGTNKKQPTKRLLRSVDGENYEYNIRYHNYNSSASSDKVLSATYLNDIITNNDYS